MTAIGQTIVSLVLLLLLFSIIFLGISADEQNSIKHYGTSDNPIADYYRQELDSLGLVVKDMLSKSEQIDQQSMQSLFFTARKHYKHIEFLVDHFYRESALKLNGPNLLEAHPRQPEQPLFPTGFQVLEEQLFTDPYSKKEVKNEVYNLLYTVNKLRSTPVKPALNDAVIIHAIRLNLFRLITKGITGFDSPVALNSLPEARETLLSARQVLAFIADDPKVAATLDRAIDYLNTPADFNSFDRAEYIVEYLNPLCEAIHHYQVDAKIPSVRVPESGINAAAPTLFVQGAFDPFYFAPSDAIPLTQAAISLGENLFQDKRLSGDGTRSCVSCHDPSKAFSDGLPTNLSLDKTHSLQRNTPGLFYAGYQNAQFLDSRLPFLEDQAHAVITNQEEMDGHLRKVAEVLGRDQSYRSRFKEVFGTARPTERMIQLALACYVRSLAPFESPFDLYMRGNKSAMNAEEVAGFNLFSGKAKCATCHFIPLFNGSLPPFYDKTESEVLGIPNQVKKDGAQPDKDSGKYTNYQMPHQRHSFKTGTLRNVQWTAPYMHNGIFPTLETVIDFYNEGGGEHYGFELPNQTLPPDQLELSTTEKAQLIAFLKCLSDPSVAAASQSHTNTGR